ncbi:MULTISPECIES: CsgE family curli-type amyloid fiber assembly protein [Halomonadaceae]|uniref:Curli production assembly/transport component CsgE n=1 Tax=Modicisalibacter zincidurans TaxID=1178777 RepID=A0ABP9RGX7_9GAMM|nr:MULTISPECIES: CsgE family curli-type amyloid fiber assembly protein [Halomonas]MCD6007337.1 curli production assembly/transport protein CsgE [Halomonas sp. IOP_31]MEA3252604.1 CsgE family curli-type amyloid fiber assembly protein [Pseudomonadota bacterium]
MTNKTKRWIAFRDIFLTILLTLFSMVANAQDAITAPDQSKEAIKDPSGINRLESPDGPKIESSYNGSSELTGVLVDRTLTVMGQNFYRAFSQIGMARPIIRGATLTIHERPDARWGIQLWITEGSRMYFRTQLSPRLSDANDIARQAIDIVEKAILKRRLSAALNPSIDLGKEEF